MYLSPGVAAHGGAGRPGTNPTTPGRDLLSTLWKIARLGSSSADSPWWWVEKYVLTGVKGVPHKLWAQTPSQGINNTHSVVVHETPKGTCSTGLHWQSAPRQATGSVSTLTHTKLSIAGTTASWDTYGAWSFVPPKITCVLCQAHTWLRKQSHTISCNRIDLFLS